MRKGFTLIELMIVIAIIAIIAAIAIPNLLESRVTANESAAGASLKAGIFPAQVQFQGGAYLDRDVDNVGEYGTLRMLAGLAPTNKMNGIGIAGTDSLKLLTGTFGNAGSYSNMAAAAAATPAFCEASGFRFAAWAPSLSDETTEVTTVMVFEGTAGTETLVAANGAAGALPAAVAVPAGSTCTLAERVWVCSCIPASWGDTGRRFFSIGNDGQVRSPADPAVVNIVYNNNAANVPANGATGTPTILSFAAGTQFSATTPVTQTAMGATTFDSNPTSVYPVYTK